MSIAIGEIAPRATCLRCLRPASVCYCARLAPTPTAIRVVFLQHPRESRVAVGTARMAHLGLANSELHLGVSFESHARVRALLARAGERVAVLYPGDDAIEPEAFADAPPRTLIVLDGTWQQVRTMWQRNPSLRRLPRIGFVPAAPGNYRIRREPAPHCLATVEAVVEVLGRLERDAPRFQPMLRAFEQMVETQIVYRTYYPRPWRRTKRRRQPGRSVARATLAARHDDLVLVYAEANAHPADSPDWGVPELIQLVAYRPATGARFVAVIGPRRPLVPSTAHHLEIDAARLLAGEHVDSALARWRHFLRPNEVLCAWGRYPADLLRREHDAERTRDGGIEPAAALLRADPVPPWTEGRAGRRIAALAAVVARLQVDVEFRARDGAGGAVEAN